jgi:hypothetical protein
MNFSETKNLKLFTSRIVVVFISLLIVSTTMNAQYFQKKIKGNGEITSITRTISDYNKISVGGNFDVTLVKGKVGTITIKTDENLLEYIETDVEKGSLSIKEKKGYQIRPKKQVEITIPFDEIEVLSLAGSGSIFTDDNIKSNKLKLSLAGSGNLDIKVTAKDLDTNIAGSGNIKLNGTSNEFECSIAGSGNLNGNKLKAKVANVKIAGSGNIKIDVQNEIHAKIVGSGNVIYTGNPKIVKSKSTGSGSIKNKN